MKIYISNYQSDKIGGGHSFSRNFAQGLGDLYTPDYNLADIYFIAGATLANHDEVVRAKNDGKLIILRADNHLLPSRNRNTGMSRMLAFAEMSDLVIYQSEWAREYISPLLKRDGPVILNGVDTGIFYPKPRDDQNKDCLYIRSSRINEKGWDMARYWFSRNFQDYGILNIVGKFSRDNLEYNFDFFNNEPWRLLGEQPHQQLADIMRQSRYFLYSYFMDACSNTLCEALMSGCQIIDIYGMLASGGAPEIMKAYYTDPNLLSLEIMISNYIDEINKIV